MNWWFYIGFLSLLVIQLYGASLKRSMQSLLCIYNLESYSRLELWKMIEHEIKIKSTKGNQIAPLFRRFQIVRWMFYLVLVLLIVVMLIVGPVE